MLDIYSKYSKNKTIFSSFQFFDEREQTELRADLTLEQQQQQQMIYMEQLRQMQLQQMQMLYPMAQPYEVMKEGGVQNNGNKQFIPNNPGFQMNPVSKDHKKHTAKDK